MKRKRYTEQLDLVWERTFKSEFSRAPNARRWPTLAYRSATYFAQCSEFV